MARRYSYSESSESEYSETDESIDIPFPRKRVVYRRRSISRHRASPDLSNTYLSPGVHIHRSVSTGPRRRKEEPPTLVVDINNDVRNRAKSKTRLSRKDTLYDDSEEETRQKHRRPRARTTTRVPSPPVRDWEMMVDQRILAKNDARQDLELNRLEQEIARLEREVARRTAEVRLLRPGEDRYEEETGRIKKLEKWEKKLEEARREAEWREKIKRREEKEESHREAELREELKKYKEREAARREAEWQEKLKKYEEKEAAEAEKERIIKELRDAEARKLLEEQERQRELAKLKAEAIEEYKAKELERMEQERKEKEEKERYFRERLKELGYVEEQIDSLVINKDKESRRKEENKTTWVKVHRKYLLPETLDAFNLPWEWDKNDRNYILIKEYISEEVQEELFAHTERIRGGRKLIEHTSSSQVELKIPEKGNKDKMYLVRKKSPRRSWIFT
ncbi:hypothetical protein DTO166G4_3287 [Paecilomyces variotii]|nr:hypothetical protein DTO166G4_3287 [Paecilomyces variotii]KAJ9222020.1 hypothetical protein DTO169C6_5649 [Paecilomyces variotii]KAJ9237674.1 hypothetical protein DTO166G5_3438 [Paecilomyces variotii]KAJ9238934.1 hypothetical protein DTO169E5_4532 [Paecilomyces variotii]KAJ9261287.1 hypothetical protein DTO195F2_4313 [Paecilomyces variotii]